MGKAIMTWENIQHFFAMGGYAPYVWISYGLALTILLGNGLALFYQHKYLLKKLRIDPHVG